MQALGQHRLRPEGFAYVWFDDAIMVNWCPNCEMPTGLRGTAIERVQMPMALRVSELTEVVPVRAAA